LRKHFERRPIEVLIPETQQEIDEVQSRVVQLKALLRDLDGKYRNAVISDRATFKTTALIQFIAEKMMNLEPPARVGVLCPSQTIVERFARAYQMEFPTLRVRNPLVATPDEVNHGKWHGFPVSEVYAEEMFMISPADIERVAAQYNFIGGIGTLPPKPIVARITNW
jgi:hypothetical protein